MAKIRTTKTAKIAAFNETLNQTQFIRTAISALWDRATIIGGLADHYCFESRETALKWARGRMSLYERAYGSCGVEDRKALSSFGGWSCK